MAENPNCTPSINNTTTTDHTFSFNIKPDICLYDWWLFKADKDVDGKRLCVGGFTYSMQKGTQVFSSAPIVKKHDFVTLQTADWLTVSISGLINKTRSIENGIPSEVCDHFRVGFPYNWDHHQYHFRDIPFATSSFCLPNDHTDIGMNMGTDSTTVKDKTALASLVSDLLTGYEMGCEQGGRDIEPHCLPAVNLMGLKEKEKLALPNDTGNENKFGVTEAVSSTAHDKTNSVKVSVGSFEVRRSGRLKNTVTNSQTLAMPPNDGFDVSVKDPNYRADTTQHELSEEHSIRLGSETNNVKPSEVNMTAGFVIPNSHMESLSKKYAFKNSDEKHLTRCPSKAVTFCVEKASTNKCLDLSEPRKSSRLKNMKTRTYNTRNTDKNKVVIGSSGSDLVTEDTVKCESTGKYVMDSSSIGPQAEPNSVSDINVVVANAESVLTLGNDGSVVSLEEEVSKDRSTILDSKTSNVNPSEANMAAPLVFSTNQLERLLMEDNFQNSGAKHSNAIRRKSKKTETQDRQYTEKNKVILGSSGSDLVTGDQIDCESGGIYAEVATDHSIILGSEMNDVNRSEVNMATQLVIPNNHLESLSGKDKCRNVAAAHVTTCPSKEVASCGKMVSVKRCLDLSETRESSRLKKMKMGTHGRQDTEKNMAILGSSGSDLVTGDEMDRDSSAKYVVDSSIIGPQEENVGLTVTKVKTVLTSQNNGLDVLVEYPYSSADTAQDKVAKDHLSISIIEANNFEPSEVNITTPLITATNHLKRSSKKGMLKSSRGKNFTRCPSGVVASHEEMERTKECMDLSETRKSSRQEIINSRTSNRQETSRSCKRLVDAANDMNRSEGKNDTRVSKQGKSQSTRKRHFEFITEASAPISRNQRKKLSFLYPEESSCKRSKSGRLVAPPLDYWRNQQLLYDRSRAVTGILNGLPVSESHTGSRSEPPRKKMKFT